MSFRPTAKRVMGAAPMCALALMLAGCSTVQSLSGAPHPGYQQDGSFVLTSHEQGEGCRALQERSLGLKEEMQQLSTQAVKQMQEVPKTIVSAWGRLFGQPGDGVPAVAEYNEARAESLAVSQALVRNGCGQHTSLETASIKH